MRLVRHFSLAALLLAGIMFVFPSCGLAQAQSDSLAATPPMGWNSWNHFATKVTDADVRASRRHAGVERYARRGIYLRQYRRCLAGRARRAGQCSTPTASFLT